VEVLVLSGYAQQCIEIERVLRGLRLDHLAVQVKTVDAVQGRESDVVIFSVTRSNLAGELGFLAEQFQGRLNVALSRAREVLWIVGDSDFCAAEEGPLKKALHHIISSRAGQVRYI
jgi:superfamily I DNA and/or RNA helicase